MTNSRCFKQTSILIFLLLILLPWNSFAGSITEVFGAAAFNPGLPPLPPGTFVAAFSVAFGNSVPYGITTDSNFIYVTEQGTFNNGVAWYSLTSPYANINTFFSTGTGSAQFELANGIKVNPSNAFIADDVNKIQEFDILFTTFVGKTPGIGYWIALDNNFLYETNGVQANFKIYNNTSPYATVATISTGAGHACSGIAVDSLYVYLVDPNFNQVQIYLKSSPYTFIGSFSTLANLGMPNGITVDGGNIYITDMNLSTPGVVVYKVSSPYTFVMKFGTAQLGQAFDVAVDSTYAYVTDQTNKSVQIFIK